VALRLRDTGRVVLIGCTLVGAKTPALQVDGSSGIYARKSSFRSVERDAVSVSKEASAHFDDCEVKEYGPNGYAFRFDQSAVFLFENTRIFQPLLLRSHSGFPVIRNCKIDTVDLRVEGAARCFLENCEFAATALEVCQKSGVRVVNSQFKDGAAEPSLRVFGSSAVAVNECEFADTKAPTAAFVCNDSLLSVSDSVFHGLAGTGIFAVGGAEGLVSLEVEGCGFGRIGASAIVVKDGPAVTIGGTLFELVRGSGAIFSNAGTVAVRGSQFSRCDNSGIEVAQPQADSTSGATIESCVFEENHNAGVYAIGGRLTINKSDFVKNTLAGIDIRRVSEFLIEDVFIDNNAGGGIAVAASPKGVINGAGISGTQAFGLAIRDHSDLTVSNLSVGEGSAPAIFVGLDSKATFTGVKVEGTAGVGLLVQGSGTAVSISNVDVNGASAGVQVIDGADVTLAGGKFQRNGVHIDVVRGGLTASGASFSESRDGVGIVIQPGSEGRFNKCEFSSEAKAGIAVGGTGYLKEATIEGCQLAGVYWYGSGAGSILQSKISNNEQCGVVIMNGSAKLSGNTIDGHTIFGVHVNPGLRTAVEISGDNTLGQNTMADVNFED
jgi:hypothetical protein